MLSGGMSFFTNTPWMMAPSLLKSILPPKKGIGKWLRRRKWNLLGP